MLINKHVLQKYMKVITIGHSIRHLSKLGVLLLREPQQKNEN